MNIATQPRQVLGAEPVRLVIGPAPITLQHEAKRPPGAVIHATIGRAVIPCIVDMGDEDCGMSLAYVEIGDQWWEAHRALPAEFRQQIEDVLRRMDWN